MSVPDCHRIQNLYQTVSKFVPECYMTQKMCDKAAKSSYNQICS